nr:hypothetical protein GCM10020092_050510 [Actinoplanes digitatis]
MDPRRLLLAIGAIEPGERDVETVHRERLTQQMTALYYKIQRGSARLRDRRAARLARMSLTADDTIIDEVRRRGTVPCGSKPRTTSRPLRNHNPCPPWPRPPITVQALTPPAVPTPSITARRPADNPASRQEPAATPEPVSATRTDPVPTPAEVAARLTPSTTSIPPRPTATRPAAGTSKPRPRKPQPTTPAGSLAASATDTPVTEPEPAQLSLPMPVDAGLLVKAREIAEQYRTEHGLPITANQLAARARVNTAEAAQALAVLDLAPDSPTTPIPTVNGNRPNTAAR